MAVRLFFRFIFFSIFWIVFAYSGELPPGISYEKHYRPDIVLIHTLEVDPAHFNIVIGLPQEGPWAYVPVIAEPYHPVAAINGGFFKPIGNLAGIPVGAMKVDNEWHCATTKSRGAIGWSNLNGGVFIDQIVVSIKAVINGKVYQADGLNLIRQVRQIILYNDFFYPKSTCTKGAGIEFIIKNNVVSKIGSTDSKIPSNGFVISADRYKRKVLSKVKEGDLVSCSFTVVPQSKPAYTHSKDWEACENVLGGKGVLVRSGIVQTDFSKDSMGGIFVHDLHPRTAVGILPNGNWLFVVVDGNQPDVSVGMTLPELAELMSSLGCVDALNLDGGGSSTMMLNGEVVNSSCGYDKKDKDSTLRKVSDAFLIIPK